MNLGKWFEGPKAPVETSPEAKENIILKFFNGVRAKIEEAENGLSPDSLDLYRKLLASRAIEDSVSRGI